MRVLFAVPHPLPLSESYVRNEIEWMERRGVVIGVWTPVPRLAVGYPDFGRRYWIGQTELKHAISEFSPHIVHAHPLFIGEGIAEELGRYRLPLTARGHVGFGTSETGDPERIRRFVDLDVVSRVWLYPHISEEVKHPKVFPLPALFMPEHFYVGSGRLDVDRIVLRIGTGLPGKGWEEFFETARLCPDIQFVAAIAVPDKLYAKGLVSFAPKNVVIRQDESREVCGELMRSAWVYLRGHDPRSHRYGMPISIAEAMASGVPVLAKYCPESRRYIGPEGLYYESLDEAVSLVKRAISWSKEERSKKSFYMVQRSAFHNADLNLPGVLEHWLSLVNEQNAL